jgi:hypothetical protein
MRVASLVLLLAVGCGRPPNSLDGSVGATVDLTFDSVELRFFAEQERVQLDYLKELPGGAIPDVVAKVVVGVPAGGFPAGEPHAMDPASDVVERVVAKGDQYADLERGEITFDEGGAAAGPAKGSFAATFVNGKTLNGTFDVEVEVVEGF